MRNFNYKSDFSLIQKFYIRDAETGDLKDMGVPEYDFTLTYYTTSQIKKYEASGKKVNCKMVYTNCRNENGKLLVLFNSYDLPPGDLKVDIRLDIPDEQYQDGIRTEIIPCPTGIKLVQGHSDCYGIAEAVAILPFIKGKDGKDGKDGENGKDGKDFTYEDMTEEEVDDFAGKVADKVMEEGIEEKIDEAIQKKLEDEFTGFEDISDDEFDSMFNE